MATEIVRDAFRALVASNTPVVLVSDPGMGKTSFVESFAEANGWLCVTRILAQMDPTDVGGGRLVIEDEDGTRYALIAPEEVRMLNAAAEADGGAILFYDEFNTAPVLVQATAHRILQEREMGGIRLHPDVRIVLAINPPESATGGVPVRPAAANRIAWLKWTASAQDFADAILMGWPQPEALHVSPNEVATHRPGFAQLVAAFLQKMGNEALHALPQDEDKASGPWPSPRSWDNAIRAVATVRAAGMAPEVESTVLRALVGDAVTGAFQAYAANLDLQDPEALLKNPGSFVLPEGRDDKLFTTMAAVVGAVVNNPTAKRNDAAWAILSSVATAGKAGAATACARTLAKVSKDNRFAVPAEAARAFVHILQQVGLL